MYMYCLFAINVVAMYRQCWIRWWLSLSTAFHVLHHFVLYSKVLVTNYWTKVWPDNECLCSICFTSALLMSRILSLKCDGISIFTGRVYYMHVVYL